MKKFLFLLLLMPVAGLYAQKFEGLAKTPPMGWNSWNTFATNISDKLVMGIADVMVNSGMKDAGYTYLVLDDGWMAMERDPETGNLVPDPAKFPNGLEPVIEYVHSKGLKFGLYNCAGTKTCAGYPGTRGYEYQDARWYAKMKIDFLKFDWCYAEGINAIEAYTTMSKAIKKAGRPILFSLCEWGSNEPWKWAAPVGQMWRVTGDIGNCFNGLQDHGNWSSLCVTTIVDLRKNIRQYAGPDHWNDFDMLEVGNGMAVNEDRAHFSLWCMLAAPLMAGNDLRSMTPETVSILTNKETIAIGQDSRGVQGYLYQQIDSVDTWIKPLADNELAICFLNRSQKPVSFTYDWKQHPVSDTVSKTNIDFNQTVYSISDIWKNTKMMPVKNKKSKKTDQLNTAALFNAEIPAHDVILLRLKPE